MRFTINWLGNYAEVTVRSEETIIGLGLLNRPEREELAKTLRETANELSPAAEEADHAEH